MDSFRDRLREPEQILLHRLSEELRVSQQTLVRWVDRHLVDASLGWSLTDDNEEVRTITLRASGKREELKGFAREYREELVTPRQARRILKVVDRRKIKRMIREGHLETVPDEDTTKIVIGSIEDYLLKQEAERASEG